MLNDAGDEVYGITQPQGYYVVFASKVRSVCSRAQLLLLLVLVSRACAAQAIHMVDALNLRVVKNITVDQSGAPLTNAGSVGATDNDTSRTWNDATFLEVCAGMHACCLAASTQHAHQ